ncbi:iron ABC transporter permease [Spongiibacter taiwanensis]|uniref:FecCD family ABC transporter permease n=1 Tax=Spongiibacter taiwanensis TaxID=1748242 RepID=UPI002035E617|nr:iron ABC transporter permease [Spongiibacter taiwanensis]USA44236.1 iron ABC transporter permease [Spongiibacter taiwanensis]
MAVAEAPHPFRPLPLLTLLGLALVSLILAIRVGSVAIPLNELWQVLSGGGSALHQTLILELRLPRALAAFATGGLLAVAGALMQVLLRNPLADPYILGLSSGSAVGALLAMLLGVTGILVSGAAFTGALISATLVFTLANGGGSWTPTRLLLTGVIISSGWTALVTFMLAVSPADKLPGMLFWLMGDLAYSTTPWPAMSVLVLTCLLLLPLGRSLNVLARGPLQAAALGIAVKPMEWSVYVLASLLTAFAVTTAGSIGFVGLIVPHMLRLMLGNDQRLILPASALAGGSLLTLADTLARSIIAPQQLPAGVITAMLGVPTFLYLLHRSR